MEQEQDLTIIRPHAVHRPKLGILQPLFQSRNFTWLWAGQSLSRFGDALLNVILPMLVYSRSGSTVAMGTTMALFMAPQVLLLPFAGLLADRWPRVPLMMLTDLVRLLVMLVAGLFVLGNHLELWLLNTLVVVYGAMEALFQPAYSAVRAEVFTPEIRNAANSLTQVTTQLAQLMGPSVAGLVIALTSNAVGLWTDATTFLISLLTLSFLHRKGNLQTRRRDVGLGAMEDFVSDQPGRTGEFADKNAAQTQRTFIGGFLFDLAGGYRELRQHAWLWMTILAFAFVNIATVGSISILIPWLVKVKLGDPSYVYGFVTSGFGLGAVITALVYGHRPNWRRRGILAYVGVAMTGIGLLSMTRLSFVPFLILAASLAGAGVTLFGLIWEGSLQELVPADMYGRVSSLDMLGSFALLPVGFMAIGWLAQKFGGLVTLAAAGIITFLIAISMLLLPTIRRFQ